MILDDLSAGLRVFGDRFDFYQGDYGDEELVARVLAEHPDLDAVVHCAASIVVPESMAEPLRYYDNNVAKLPRLPQDTLLSQQLGAAAIRVQFDGRALRRRPRT